MCKPLYQRQDNRRPELVDPSILTLSTSREVTVVSRKSRSRDKYKSDFSSSAPLGGPGRPMMAKASFAAQQQQPMAFGAAPQMSFGGGLPGGMFDANNQMSMRSSLKRCCTLSISRSRSRSRDDKVANSRSRSRENNTLSDFSSSAPPPMARQMNLSLDSVECDSAPMQVRSQKRSKKKEKSQKRGGVVTGKP